MHLLSSIHLYLHAKSKNNTSTHHHARTHHRVSSGFSNCLPIYTRLVFLCDFIKLDRILNRRASSALLCRRIEYFARCKYANKMRNGTSGQRRDRHERTYYLFSLHKYLRRVRMATPNDFPEEMELEQRHTAIRELLGSRHWLLTSTICLLVWYFRQSINQQFTLWHSGFDGNGKCRYACQFNLII